MQSTPNYVPVIVVLVAFLAWRLVRAARVRRRVRELKAQGALVLDVRSRQEFAAGHLEGSLNIPLDELPQRLREVDASRPVIVCCASGARSAMACRLLGQAGFGALLNGGSWRNCA